MVRDLTGIGPETTQIEVNLCFSGPVPAQSRSSTGLDRDDEFRTGSGLVLWVGPGPAPWCCGLDPVHPGAAGWTRSSPGLVPCRTSPGIGPEGPGLCRAEPVGLPIGTGTSRGVPPRRDWTQDWTRDFYCDGSRQWAVSAIPVLRDWTGIGQDRSTTSPDAVLAHACGRTGPGPVPGTNQMHRDWVGTYPGPGPRCGTNPSSFM